MVKNINHIGIAVKSIEQAALFYNKIGLNIESIEEVPSQKLRVGFIHIGETKIELLEPTSEDSPIAKFIEKKGEGIQHIAFSVDNIEEALNNCKNNDIQLIDNNPRPGAGGANIAFLHPKSALGVLFEFCEKKH